MHDGFASAVAFPRMRHRKSLNSNSGLGTAASRTPSAALAEFAAAQRGWRDFRIAQ
jgi:hypothetical protein